MLVAAALGFPGVLLLGLVAMERVEVRLRDWVPRRSARRRLPGRQLLSRD